MSVTSTDLCGQIVGGGGTSFTFQPTANAPATDPTDPASGATVVMICVQYVDESEGNESDLGISDDATADVCGEPYTNIWTPGGALASFGGFCAFHTYFALIGAPLVAGVTNITVEFAETATFVAVTGRVYTGLAFDQVGLPVVGGGNGTVSLAGGGGDTDQLSWNYSGGGGSPFVLSPVGAGSGPNWQWTTGDIGVYMVCEAFNTPSGPWTWVNPNIVTQSEYDDVTTPIGLTTIVYAEQDLAGLIPDVGEDLSGSFSGGLTPNQGGGYSLITGLGPTCAITPPPGAGLPILHTQIRLSE